jgi:hypothetical protein
MPVTILAILEHGPHRASFLDIPEDATVGSLLLQAPVEPFGHTVGLRFGEEGESHSNAQGPDLIEKADLIEKVVGGILRGVIHAPRQAATSIGTGGTEFGLQPLSNRL